ncbi:hypothetical protein D8812_04085 [Streptococcus gordonii]|nr:hypothetical protein D8812_04085 [Streptococcus gordonii]
MKKIVLGATATLSLLLVSCSQQEKGSNSVQEQNTEQFSSSSEATTSSSSTTDVLKGRSAYDVFLENFKAWIHETDSTAKVVSTKNDISVIISLALSDEQIQKSQPMVDGILKIKQAGEEELRKYDSTFKAPNLIVLDANAKVIAQEQDGKMILNK